MAKYRGTSPITSKDLKRAKLEAKRARTAKMNASGGLSVKHKKAKGFGFSGMDTKKWIIIGASVAAVAIIGMIAFLVLSQRPSEEDLLSCG